MCMYLYYRLRPYFLTLCKPELTKEDCEDDKGFTKYIENYNCTREGISEKDIGDAAKSFFSGHSSFSFYCATFLIVFLHARLSGKLKPDKTNREAQKAHRWVRILFRGLRILRPFMQFGIFLLAFFICLTRITDYKHHATDVITGALIGVVYALILLMFVIKLFDNPVVFHFRGNQDEYLGEEGGSNKYKDKETNENTGVSDKLCNRTHLPLKPVTKV